MKPAATVSNALVTAILDGLSLSEADGRRFLERSGISPERVRDINARTPMATFVPFWAEVLRLTDDPCIGLRIGETIPGSRFGLATYVAENSRDLRQLLDRFAQYARLINDLIVCTLEDTPPVARFTLNFLWDIGDLERHAVDIAFVGIVVWLRGRLGPRSGLQAVRLKHSLRAAADRYAAIFRVPIEFGCPRNELVFDAGALDVEIPSSNLELGLILDRHARSEIARIPVLTDLPARISQILGARLQDGEPAELSHVCAALKLPERQLQRKLREASTTFSALLDDARRTLAPTLLTDPAANVEQVGFQLGYAEPTAFIRAFKKWYGMTPGEYRKRRS
jgi:AraC-like DNA-binding protein